MNKKLLFSLLITTAISTSMMAQTDIPNGNFETWTSATVPYSWVIANGNRLTNDSSVKPHSGTYALSVRNTSVGLGTAVNTFPFLLKPVSFEGYFGFNRDNANERFDIIVALTRWDTLTSMRDTVSYTLFKPVIANADLPSWTLVQFNLEYDTLNLFTPDTATVFITTGGGTQNFLGTVLTMDDLGFKDFSAGIKHPGNEDNNLRIFNYPNPFQTTTEIVYNLQKAGMVNVSLFDITGKELSTIYNGRSEAGENHLEFDGSELQNGIYFYRIHAADATEMGKMIINR